MPNRDPMRILPSDLAPLPSQPWFTRPDDLPLDPDEVRTALWIQSGVIVDAANMLKVPSKRLRAFIEASEFLTRERKEAEESIKDIAESNVLDALTDGSDSGRRDTMSRWFLERKAKDRGYTTASGPGKNGRLGGRVVVLWEDEDTGPMIEGTVSPVAANDG